MDKLVFDIETKNTFADVGGEAFIKNLNASVVGVYSYDKDAYFCFEESEFGRLGEMFQRAALLIGFSINRFDIPVLAKYFKFNLKAIANVDILEEIEKPLGRRVGLNDLAMANVGAGKTRHSLEAITLYREGKMKELKEYCLNDVKITKDVYDLAVNQGYLWIPQRNTPQMIKLEIDLKREIVPQPSLF